MEQLKRAWSFLVQPRVYWRLFSLLLAVIFWLLAAGDGSFRGTERIVTLEVAVHNLAADQIIVDHPEPVKANITGLSPFLNRSGEAVRAYIDLSEALPGRRNYAVEVDAPVGIEVISVTPRWVNIETEQLVKKTFPVAFAVLGKDPLVSISEIKSEPDTVTVTARGSILQRVDLVVAYLSLNGDLTRLEGSFPVQVLDAQGRSLGGVTVEPSEVRLKIELEQIEPGDGPVGEEGMIK